MEKLKEILEYNLTEVLLMIALLFIFIAIEIACFVFLINLTSTLGFLGFIGAACLMLFVLFIFLFIIVSIYEWM